MSELVVPVVLGQRSKCVSELVVSRFLSEISELTSVKKEDVISTLQYLNLINYYKVRGHRSTNLLTGSSRVCQHDHPRAPHTPWPSGTREGRPLALLM